MRKLAFILAFLLIERLFANPIVIPPVISEFFYNGGDWKLELYFDSEIHGYSGPILNFDEFSLSCNAGYAYFNPGIPFYYDSLYVIDQSWLASPVLINPDIDCIDVCSPSLYSDMVCYGYESSPAPGPGESIAIQYTYNLNGSFAEYIFMKQSNPTIGSDPFNVSDRTSFSGYVFDQYQNPLEGAKMVYCDPSYCNGFYIPTFECFETNEFGYFECENLFPMNYLFKITYDDYIYQTDILFLEPDSSHYKEYTLTSVDIADYNTDNQSIIWAAPNPFTQKTNFHIAMPDNQRWKSGKITIRSINGQLVDVIEFPNASWSDNTFSIPWYPAMARADVFPGLYIYSLEIDGMFVDSGKMIIQN